MHTLVPLRGRPLRLPSRAHLPSTLSAWCGRFVSRWCGQRHSPAACPATGSVRRPGELCPRRPHHLPHPRRARQGICRRTVAGGGGWIDLRHQEDGADILRASTRAATTRWRRPSPSAGLSGGPDKSGAADGVRKVPRHRALGAGHRHRRARRAPPAGSRFAHRLAGRRCARAARWWAGDWPDGCRKELMVRLQAALLQRADGRVSAMVHGRTPCDSCASPCVPRRVLEGSGPVERRLQPGEVARFDWKVVASSPERRQMPPPRRIRCATRWSCACRCGRTGARVGGAGASGDGVAESFVLLPGCREEVTLTQLAPSLASRYSQRCASVLSYGCTEQTMSAFLPDTIHEPGAPGWYTRRA